MCLWKLFPSWEPPTAYRNIGGQRKFPPPPPCYDIFCWRCFVFCGDHYLLQPFDYETWETWWQIYCKERAHMKRREPDLYARLSLNAKDRLLARRVAKRLKKQLE